jgi:hypothetical protein
MSPTTLKIKMSSFMTSGALGGENSYSTRFRHRLLMNLSFMPVCRTANSALIEQNQQHGTGDVPSRTVGRDQTALLLSFIWLILTFSEL